MQDLSGRNLRSLVLRRAKNVKIDTSSHLGPQPRLNGNRHMAYAIPSYAIEADEIEPRITIGGGRLAGILTALRFLISPHELRDPKCQCNQGCE